VLIIPALGRPRQEELSLRLAWDKYSKTLAQKTRKIIWGRVVYFKDVESKVPVSRN
jgi:hypothetical protein